MWSTTRAVIEHLLLGGPRALPAHLWARDLWRVSERTIAQTHLRRWAAPLWSHPPSRALGGLGRALLDDLRPGGTESRSEWLRRALSAAGNPSRPNAEQERLVGARGIQPRFRRRVP